MKTVSGNEIKKMIESEKVRIVDIDTKANFKDAHLKGSINMPHNEKDLAQKIAKKFNSKSEKIVICARPTLKSHAKKLCSDIEKSGYKNVYEYTADPSDWKSAGLSVI